jgi:peptidylprolyl isomerase
VEASHKKDQAKIQEIVVQLTPAIDEEFEKRKFVFSPEARKTYTTVGGTPHLDGNYTVFGEVVEGLDVVDKIASQKTDPNSRPFNDIRFTISIVK